MHPFEPDSGRLLSPDRTHEKAQGPGDVAGAPHSASICRAAPTLLSPETGRAYPGRPMSDESASTWRGELAATLRLAGPLAAANLLQMLVYAVDVIFVAKPGE